MWMLSKDKSSLNFNPSHALEILNLALLVAEYVRDCRYAGL